MNASWVASAARSESRMIRQARAYRRVVAAVTNAANASWSPCIARRTSAALIVDVATLPARDRAAAGLPPGRHGCKDGFRRQPALARPVSVHDEHRSVSLARRLEVAQERDALAIGRPCRSEVAPGRAGFGLTGLASADLPGLRAIGTHDPDSLVLTLAAGVRDRGAVRAPVGELVLGLRAGRERLGLAAIGVHDPDLLVDPGVVGVGVVLVGEHDLLPVGGPRGIVVGAAGLAVRTARERDEIAARGIHYIDLGVLVRALGP